MTDLVTLCLPRGQDTWTFPISHGDRCYTPYRADHTNEDSDWHVQVPPHVAQHLLHRGGFSMVAAATATVIRSIGSCRMRHPDGNSCGWNGMSFVPDEDGVVTVPLEAVPDLLPHGFLPVPPKADRKRRAPEPAPAPLDVTAVQGSDRAGVRFEKDADGTPHPDGVADAPPPPAPAPDKA